MHRRFRTLAAITLLFSLLLSCRVWSFAPERLSSDEPVDIFVTGDAPLDEGPANRESQVEATLPVGEGHVVLNEELGGVGLVQMGDPAGCLSEVDKAGLSSGMAMLAYADTLVRLNRPFVERILTGAWNGYTHRYLYETDSAMMLDVSDVENEYLLQRMLNVLHVAGFVTWLRESERQEQGIHILALPLLNPNWAISEWAPYIQAYWQDPLAVPSNDEYIIPAQKLPPCAWMVSGGFAPLVDAGWWAVNKVGWPDYAAAAQKYLAANTSEANQVARQIDWLGAQLEGATTMCGPLSWSILNDSGAFMPGFGAWTAGSKTFWLAKPTTNGRPWSLFPPGSYTVYHFAQPISQFDFKAWPLYPGDFLYTYSIKDGFDHMLVITEVNPDGSIYTVTNLVQEEPEFQLTIERSLLVNPNDLSLGLVRNEWRDRANGRTGHAGFDVMRWDWMVKDIEKQPATYVVMPGDTLGLVSVRWKTPADKIAMYNNIPMGATLAVGQVLNIPPNDKQQP